MELQEILRTLPTLDDVQLRQLNAAIIAQIKGQRRVNKAVAAVTIVTGQEYRTKGLRPKHNGIIVRVLEKKQTKALVDWDGRRVLVSMDCLEAVA